ncbi:MAG: hypothetical protein FWC23_10995, partial [Chitinispirillia bacterium]|nr:hypothetical protein [Chitinispirillia bacterium]MCL2269694.1 hypothetical protein [Chitinispirillia bacterium]
MTVNRFSRFLSAVIIMGLAALSGCAGSAASGRGAGSTGLQLDDAIKQAAALISARVEAGTKIALLNFKSPADRFSEYFINELEA